MEMFFSWIYFKTLYLFFFLLTFVCVPSQTPTSHSVLLGKKKKSTSVNLKDVANKLSARSSLVFRRSVKNTSQRSADLGI